MRRNEKKLRLWTLQSLAAWQELERAGVLYCREELADKAFLAAYQWMCEQMRLRIGVAPEAGIYPLWGWYHWHGDEKPRPDMRYGGQLPPGQPGMRITFEVEAEKVLLSDFVLWHHVLNGWYLGASLEDDAVFEQERQALGIRYPLGHSGGNGIFEQRVRTSWQKIFDLAWCDRDQYISLPQPQKSIQATFWTLQREQVLKAEYFCGRGHS